MCTVTEATEKDRADWELFINEQNVDHHSYCWEWKAIIAKVFGHKPTYFICRDRNNKIIGALPLFHVKSPLFGAALISVPYLNGGGVVTKSSDALEQLTIATRELASKTGVNYVELRNRSPLENLIETPLGVESQKLSLRSHKVAMKLDLSDDPEKLFASFTPKLRSQVRRPTKSGVYLEATGGKFQDSELIDSFFQVFSENMRDLGTPVYGKALFRETLLQFGNRAKVFIAFHDGKPLSAGITIARGNSIEIPWASSLRKYNNLSANMLMYWEAIKQACLDGGKTFDFGRSSPDSGTFRFKQQWGAKPLPLHWYYHLAKGSIPDVNPNSPKYALLVNSWRKLPLPIANLLGPILTKGIP